VKICKLTPEYFDKLIAFNEKVFSERVNFKERFKSQFLDNPYLEDREKPCGYLSLSDEDAITGQFLINPCRFHFKGNDYGGFFGHDFYALQEYGGEHGAMLALRAIRGSKPYFAIGVTEKAQKIHLSVKARIIGSMYKYVWFGNIILSSLKMAKYFISRNDASSPAYEKADFPQRVRADSGEIKLSKTPRFTADYHWENMIEFARDSKFLEWRFAERFASYGFYTFKSDDKECFFALRRCFWKGLKLLALVDYRTPPGDANASETVLKASKIIAKKMKRDGVISYSSNHFYDTEFKRQLFFRAGRPCYIMTNAKMDVREDDIEERKSVFATMADSDTDFNFD